MMFEKEETRSCDLEFDAHHRKSQMQHTFFPLALHN